MQSTAPPFTIRLTNNEVSMVFEDFLRLVSTLEDFGIAADITHESVGVASFVLKERGVTQ